MKKQLKKILLLLIAITITLPLVACKLPWQNEESNEDKEITLTYWGLWKETSVMEEVIARYEELHPNVTIKYEERPYSDGLYKDQLLERLADSNPNKAPDIMRIHNTWLPQFEDELYPLPSKVMSDSEYSQTFYSVALEDFKTDNGIFAIPLGIDTLGLFYNKDLLAQEGLITPPKDWDQFIEYAKKLTKFDEEKEIITQAGAAMGSSSNILHSTEIFSLLMLQSNIDIVDEENYEAIFDVSNNEQGEVVLEYYVDFINEHNVWSTELSNDLEMFKQGKLAMMIAPSWRVFEILEENPNFEFDTANVPQISLGQEINYATYWAEAVSKDSENPEAAWEFIKFLSEQEQLETMYEAESDINEFGEIYSRKDMREEIKNDPYVGPFVNMAQTAQSWFMGNDREVDTIFSNMITTVLNGKDEASEISKAAEALTTELQNFKEEE